MACHPGSRAPAAPGLRDKETLRGTCSSREGRAAGWDATRRRVPGFQGRALTQCCPTRGGSRRARGPRPGSCQGRGAGPYGAPAACAAPGVGSSEPDAAPVLRLVTRREAHDGTGRRWQRPPPREERRQRVGWPGPALTRAPRPWPGPQTRGDPSPAPGSPGVCPAAAPGLGRLARGLGSGRASCGRLGSGQRCWDRGLGRRP